MKSLYRIFFCTFAITLFYSCEPEELNLASESGLETDYYSGTGDQENPIDDHKD